MNLRKKIKWCCLFLVGVGLYSSTTALPLSSEQKKEILQELCVRLNEVRAFDFNYDDCVKQLMNSKPVSDAKTRYQFMEAVNNVLESIGVSHLMLSDKLMFFDYEFLLNKGILKLLSSEKVLPTFLKGKFIKSKEKGESSRSRKFLVSEVEPTMMSTCLKKEDKILRISEPIDIQKGLIIWSMLSDAMNDSESFFERAEKCRVKFKPLENKEDIDVPNSKIRLAISYSGEGKGFVPMILWPHIKQLPSDELIWLGQEKSIPLLRISGFFSKQMEKPDVGKFTQLLMCNENQDRFVQPILPYNRGSLKENLKTISKSPCLIIDLRDNGGGSVSEFSFLAHYGFGARYPFCRYIFPEENQVSKEKFSYKIVKSLLLNVLTKGGTLPIEDAMDEAVVRVLEPIFEEILGSSWQQYFEMYQGKIAILVNKNTYSAGESFVYQMKTGLDPKKCIVIGEKTAGAFLGEIDQDLIHGFYLRTPQIELMPTLGSADRLEGVGVTPDIIIDQPGHAAFGEVDPSDKCIQAAREWFNEKQEGTLNNALKLE